MMINNLNKDGSGEERINGQCVLMLLYKKKTFLSYSLPLCLSQQLDQGIGVMS